MENLNVELYSDWRHFVGNKKDFAPKIVPQVIVDSWKRSQEYQIDPFSSGFRNVSAKELERRRMKKADLCKVATPYINNLYEVIKGSGSLIVLSDEDGVIIDLASDEASHSIRNFPEAGTIQSESVVGTNGIGTALACKSLIQIRGAEHWLLDNHSWICNAAPIISKGVVIGCLNLSSPSQQQNDLSLGLISSAVTAITRELELRATLKEVRFLTQQQNAILKLMENGVIFISGNGSVIQANTRAHEIMKDFRHWDGMPISEIIRTRIDFMELLQSQTMLEAHEISLRVHKQYTHIHISTELIQGQDTTEAMAIVLHESKSMMKIANKIAGSTAHYNFSDIIGTSPALGDCIFLAKQAANTNANVLILGESGTGKELIAQSIHNGSDRRNRQFIAVNCGALSRELIHSELFGYEGGAFTGAKSDGNPGKFELADGGTIFLDEIGELPLESQVALLRVLQTNEVTRIGSAETKSINVRVITATNKRLIECVRDKSFREDLFFRINIFTIDLPPLRSRRNDVRLLTNSFIERYKKDFEKSSLSVSEESFKYLENYQWPGNIRQLENVIERAIVICEGNVIIPANLPEEITGSESGNTVHPEKDRRNNSELKVVKERHLSYTSLEQIQREHLKKQLEEVDGNLRELSKRLNVSRSTIYRKIQQYHLHPENYRNRI